MVKVKFYRRESIMADTTKDTIYIDIDDEITSIIDKVRASKHKIVALVLPKRAATLQSIVNMKLLKRTGAETDKRIVLITSEASLLPLAGIVGMYTAKTLQSKPVIPRSPDTSNDADSLDDDEEVDEPEIDNKKSIGELSGYEEEPVDDEEITGSKDAEETIEVDNTSSTDKEVEEVSKKAKKNKIKVPDFEGFRLKLFLGMFLIIALIVGWYFAFKVMPKVSVVVKTDTRTVTSSLNFSAQVDIKTLDVDKSLVPAVVKELKKTDTAKIAATGKKNVGEKAVGTITLKNCTKVDGALVIPSGTSVTSSPYVFLTQADVSLPPSSFSGGNACLTATKTVSVVAQNSGGQYNLKGARSFVVSGYSSVLGTESDIALGTDKNITVISQQDIDGAKTSLLDKSKDTASAELSKTLTSAGLSSLPETILGADQVITTVPNVGDEAADVTVTSVTSYTMLGVKTDDLKKLVDVDASKQIDITKQPIVDYGLDKAVYRMTSKRSANDQSLSFQTVSTAGAKIDPEALKKEIIGKKKGDVQQIVGNHPGVKDVAVTFSPPWVSTVPNKTARITIIFEQTNSNGK
ncbi:MAG: hypothetical protein WCJ86_01100 [Candidatus Saccharibacteria bacterium]